MVLNEPSVVAYSASDSRVVAVGSHARQLLGRTPGRIIVSRPMRDGVIADCVVTEAMLTYFIGKVVTRFSLFRPVVMVCLGLGANGAFGRAVVHAAMQAGALDVQVIAEPLAAALGANVPISSASANMVVDLGAAWTKAAVLSRNHTIVSHSVGIGGNKIDEMIASYVRRKHNLIIGERTAEEIKFAIGSAVPLENDLEVEVRGRDATEGLPTLRSVRSSEVTEAIGEALLPIVRVVNQLLDRAPAVSLAGAPYCETWTGYSCSKPVCQPPWPTTR